MKTIQENRKGELGFTLLELLLVVGVGAILLIAGIGTFQLVTQNNKLNEGSQLLSTVKDRVQDIFKAQARYGGLNEDITSLVVNAGGFPPDALDGSGNPVTPWDTPVLVIAIFRSFRVEFQDLPEEACIKMGIDPVQNDPSYSTTSIGGTVGLGVSLTESNARCSATAADNDIQWTFF